MPAPELNPMVLPRLVLDPPITSFDAPSDVRVIRIPSRPFPRPTSPEKSVPTLLPITVFAVAEFPEMRIPSRVLFEIRFPDPANPPMVLEDASSIQSPVAFPEIPAVCAESSPKKSD